MTGQGPRKSVDAGHSPARLRQAREFHESARSLVTLAQSKSYNSAVTLLVTAAIAYSDAITARAKGVVNKQDHQSAPRLLREVRADYTDEARRANIEGEVELEIVVRRDGTVGEVKITRGLRGGLNERAVNAVRQWRFSPGRMKGVPVDVVVEVGVEFRLR